jgi:hypothetical protein
MMREWCVQGDDLAALIAAPVGTRIDNGPEDEPIHFIKTGGDEWRPCDSDGTSFSDRSADQRLEEPMWLGPFESEQIHRFGLKFCEPLEPTMCPYGHGSLENGDCPDCGFSL